MTEFYSQMREAAKEASKKWETFEQNNPEFPYPRINYRHVIDLVHSENDSPEAIARATRYFDQYEMWLMRAESYRHLADELPNDFAIPLARTVYEFTYPYLATVPHTDTGEDPTTQGTLNFNNVLQTVSWAVAKSKDAELIKKHRDYLHNQLTSELKKRGHDDGDIGPLTEYSIHVFESAVNPEPWCAKNRLNEGTMTNLETEIGVLACYVCSGSYIFDGKDVVMQDNNDCKYK